MIITSAQVQIFQIKDLKLLIWTLTLAPKSKSLDLKDLKV